MASITSTRSRGASRPAADAQPSQARRLRDAAETWLNHPLASMVLVLVPAVLLLALGSAMVLSASSVYAHFQFGDTYYFLKRQIIFLALGLVGGFLLTRVPTERLKASMS